MAVCYLYDTELARVNSS